MAAASAAAGTTLTEPVDLGGSARTTVLRCRTTDGTTVVVKAQHDHSPYFVARLILTGDLGAAPSLADTLLGSHRKRRRPRGGPSSKRFADPPPSDSPKPWRHWASHRPTTRRWHVDPLPPYPAFTPSPPTIVSS